MVVRFMVAAAAAKIFLPVPMEPVSETLATRGSVVSRTPVRASPWTTLKTPSGNPACVKISARRAGVDGVSSEVLKIMALPQASAGAAFQQAIWIG